LKEQSLISIFQKIKKTAHHSAKAVKYLWFKKELDCHEFYLVIPKMCERSYTILGIFSGLSLQQRLHAVVKNISIL